jgi:RNA polymerase sigma-70 factor (ECF subfamily)
VQTEGEIVQVGIEQAAGAIPLTFDDLYAAEHDRLYGALFFITGSSADAEELMQDAFLKLWERWDRIDAIQDPVAYLFRVALNGFRMRLRHAKVVAARHLPTIEPRDSFAEVEMHEDVRRMLLRLPDRQRAALVLTEIFGYGSDQASEILGVRAATVRSLASQGRAALRET